MSGEEILEQLRALNVHEIDAEFKQMSEEVERINACLEKIISEQNGLMRIRKTLPDDSRQKIDIDIRLNALDSDYYYYKNELRNLIKRKAVLDEKKIRVEKKGLELINELRLSVGGEEAFAKQFPNLLTHEKTIKEDYERTTGLKYDIGKDGTDKKETINSQIDGVDAETSEKVHTLLGSGQKIEAIKVYMEKSGTGLAEAKNIVEKYAEQQNLNDLPNNTPTNPVNDTPKNQDNDTTKNQDNDTTNTNSGGGLSTFLAIAAFVVFFLLLFGKYLF